MTATKPCTLTIIVQTCKSTSSILIRFFFFQAEAGIRALYVTGVQTCALPISSVHVTLRATLNVLSDQGVGLRLADEDAGRIESEYFDVTQFQPEAQNYPPAERQIRMNFQIRPDTLGRGSILLISTVYQPFNVGVAGSRRRDHLGPSDHPGATYTKKILAKIEEAALGPERGFLDLRQDFLRVRRPGVIRRAEVVAPAAAGYA